MKAVNIKWDWDQEEGQENLVLPEEIEIPNGMTDEDEISDYITNFAGFCHKGFELSGEEAQLDTIYSADIDVYEGEHYIGTHKYDFNATLAEIKGDDNGLYEVKMASKQSLMQWFKAKGLPSGEYDLFVEFSRHDGYGEEPLDHDEVGATWNYDLGYLQFILN